MSETTHHLRLPFIAASQAQKHVTHNEALVLLDALAHLAAKRRQASPPPQPAMGDRFLVTAGAGSFQGFDDAVAHFEGGGWSFLVPSVGWRLWLEDERAELVFTASGWEDLTPRAARRLGVNAAADDQNRLAVASPSVLFDHAGAGSQVKINRASPGTTASLLFQSGYAGHAELGLAGDNLFRVKTSADGSSWNEALCVNGTGLIGLGTSAPTCRLDVAGPVRLGQFAKAGLPSAAASGTGAVIYVSDDVGGPVLAFSDGASWRRVTDRAVVS